MLTGADGSGYRKRKASGSDSGRFGYPGIQNLVEDITMGQTGFSYIPGQSGQGSLCAEKTKVVYRMNPEWFSQGTTDRCAAMKKCIM